MSLHHPCSSFFGAQLSVHHSFHVGMVSLQTKLVLLMYRPYFQLAIKECTVSHERHSFSTYLYEVEQVMLQTLKHEQSVIIYLRFPFLTADTMLRVVFWVVVMYGYKHFRGKFSLHLQGEDGSDTSPSRWWQHIPPKHWYHLQNHIASQPRQLQSTFYLVHME